MDYIKMLKNSFLFTFIFYLLGFFILTTLNYFGLISGVALSIISILILIISILGGSFLQPIKSKGWLEGLKYGGIMLVIVFPFGLTTFVTKRIIFYLILLASGVVGGMLKMLISKEKN